MRKVLLCTICVFIGLNITFAQTGDELFNKKDYHNAILKYTYEVKSNPSAYMNLAKSYFALREFDNALDAMRNYLARASNPDKKYADLFVELLERNDDYVEVTNVGSIINTSNADYYPVISQDGKTLYFIGTDRSGGLGGEDVWFSTINDDGSWSAPQPINELNTTSHESVMTISGDGNVAIMFGNYEGKFGGGDLFYSVKTSKGWTMPCNMGGTINSDVWDAQAMLAADGKTLFFCSSRVGGQGGSDIYVSTLTEDGWTTPINLGPTINTPGADGGPYLAADGKTLYFYSDGLPGFGGRDMFMSRKTGDSWTSWSTPVNLGKYINTIDNDAYLTIPASGIKGFTVKTDKVDGYGAEDIYEFVLPRSMRPETVFNVYGVVTDENNNPVGALIHFIDAATGKEQATAISGFADGVYKVSLPPFKKYHVVIDMKGYLYYTDEIDLTNLDQFLKKENINDRLINELPQIKKAREKLENLNMQLQQYIDGNSSNVDDAFTSYEDLVKEYRLAINNLDLSIKRAKLEWLTEENENLDIRKDFQLQEIRVGAKFELENIFFESGKAILTEESKAELDKLVDIMNRSEIIIELGGYTDNVGSDEANLKLSQDRVNSAMTYLVEKGVKANRITAVGYGEQFPVADNESEEGRQKNRRVEVKITEVKGREGRDVVIEKEEDRKVYEEQEFDFLATLQKAAKKGGLPKGSPCSDKISYLHDGEDLKPITPKKPGKIDLGFEEVTKDNYYLKTFNPYVRNYNIVDFGNKDTLTGSSLGAGVSFVGENLNEFFMEYYFMPEDSLKWMGATGYLWNWQFFRRWDFPLITTFGFTSNFYQFNNSMSGDKGGIYFNMPLGLKFNYALSDNLVICPQYIYYFGHDFKSPIQGATSKHWEAGVNARWRFINGGLYLNKGQNINFLGFKAGFAF